MEVILRRASIRSSLWVLIGVACLQAETGHDAWLRYAAVYPDATPAVVTTLDNAAPIASARAELIRGVRGMTGKTLRAETGVPKEAAFVLATLATLPASWGLNGNLRSDAYWLKTITNAGIRYTVVTAANDRGVLYGPFA